MVEWRCYDLVSANDIPVKSGLPKRKVAPWFRELFPWKRLIW